MVTKEKLKEYAANLMFDMKEEEYDTLTKEFEIIEKQMDKIGTMSNLKNVEPMTFPFINYQATLRDDDEDIDGTCINKKDVLSNAKDVLYEQVKVPKVVE